MEKNGKGFVAATIDEYLENIPEIPRQTLQKVRKAIRSAAPKATEIISYQIPTFKQEYALIAFAAFKDHCSIFTMSNEVMKQLAEDFVPYYTKGVTIHFPLDKPLPAVLIKKIVRLRLAEVAVKTGNRDKKKKTGSAKK